MRDDVIQTNPGASSQKLQTRFTASQSHSSSNGGDKKRKDFQLFSVHPDLLTPVKSLYLRLNLSVMLKGGH